MLGSGLGLILITAIISGFSIFSGTQLGLTLAIISHVIFHGTFFVFAYVIGEHYAGRWGGAWACALEGIFGYTGFLISQHPNLFF
jgi:hypothetical protein